MARMNEANENFAAAAALIARSSKIVISGHVSPDGDSLGSMVALMLMLRAAGHDAVAVGDPKAFGKPGFLEGAAEVLPLRRFKPAGFDLLLAVDCASADRLPAELRPLVGRIPTLVIDHHRTNTGYGDLSIVDGEASSAGELVWRFAKWNEWGIDRPVAEALWTAIVTDSGRFAYDSTSVSTMRAAGDLLRRGVRTSEINDILFGSFPRKAIELKRLAWRSLHVWKNRAVAEVTLSLDDFRSVRGTKADAEDVIDIPRSTAGNRVALFFYQLPDRSRETRVSIRTRGDIDATAIASRFGGGGHLRAAGCTVKASMGVAKRKVRAVVKALLAGKGGK